MNGHGEQGGAGAAGARPAEGVPSISRTRRALAAAAFAFLGLALVIVLRTAAASVQAGSDALLEAEASAAVALWRGGAGSDAVDSLVPGRWSAEPLTAPGTATALDRPAVGGDVARAALYGPDGWNALATLRLERRPPSEVGGRTGVPWWLALAAAAVSALLALAAWMATSSPGRWRGGALAVLALALLVAAAQRWSERHLSTLTDVRLDVAARALLASGMAGTGGASPGDVLHVTGLPLLERTPSGGVEATTLLPATAAALAAPPVPAPARTTVDAVPWALRDQGAYRLAMVPLEHTKSPLAPMAAAALAGLLLAALPVSLVPLMGRRRALRRNLWAWSFLAPSALHLAVFTLGPLAFAAWLSLHRWNLVDVARPFVGLGNYAALLGDASFWNAVLNTALFTLHVPVAMALALAFALLVHRRTRTLLAVRAALFLPSITSLVAIAVVWQWILNSDYGILNWVLGLVGLGPVPWLTSPKTALLSIMLLSVWMVVGYQMVLFQAGLAAIPQELYEAARIDGAGPWQRFWHVTLPGLRHTLFFVLVTSVIGSFQIFGAVYVMTEGGPLGATDVAVYHIYKEAWEFLRFGSAAAQSWVLFAVIFVVTWLHFRILERQPAENVPSGHGVAR